MSETPRLGCAAVIRKDDKILLGVRGKEPGKGNVIIPGGKIEFLESFKDTARREMLEETGLSIKVSDIIGVYELINPPSEHRVIVYCWADWVSGNVKPSSDLEDAKFYSKEEVKEIISAGKVSSVVLQVLKDVKWA